MYIYDADTYCDSCGDAIRAELDAECVPDCDDSGGYPQWAHSSGEVDYPDHCATGAKCREAIDLRPYGAPKDDYKVGELVGDDLTDDGVEYLREMLDEPDPTPYQSALHAYWREAFASQL